MLMNFCRKLKRAHHPGRLRPDRQGKRHFSKGSRKKGFRLTCLAFALKIGFKKRLIFFLILDCYFIFPDARCRLLAVLIFILGRAGRGIGI